MSKGKNKEESKAKDEKKRFDDRQVEEFDEMNLRYEILRGIYSYGFEKPSKIQKAILPLTSKPAIDAIIQVESSRTEKVIMNNIATFAISCLQNLDDQSPNLQGLILAPTGELASQIFRMFLDLSKYTKFKIHCCVGGTKVKDDIDVLKKGGLHIIIGTLGRVKHMVEEDYLPVEQIKVLIIDRADEMLSKGFKDQLYDLFKYLPENMQINLFSATMPPDVVSLSEKFLRDPLKILMKKERLTLEGIKQYFVDAIFENNKYIRLIDIYKTFDITKAIIFCNSRKIVDQLAERMNQDQFTVSCLHGGLKDEKAKIMKEFRTGSTRVLIATDLLGIADIGFLRVLVINYDLPRQKECYLHRIGRSGRKGVSINLLTERDYVMQKEIETYFKTKIDPLPKDVNKFL